MMPASTLRPFLKAALTQGSCNCGSLSQLTRDTVVGQRVLSRSHQYTTSRTASHNNNTNNTNTSGPASSNNLRRANTQLPSRIQRKSTVTVRTASSYALPVDRRKANQSPESTKPQQLSENTIFDGRISPNSANIDDANTVVNNAAKEDIKASFDSPSVPKITYVRTVPTLSDPYNNDHLPKLNLSKFRNPASNTLSIYSYKRKLNKTKVSKFIEIISPVSEEGTHSEVHRNNTQSRPLVLLYPWLMANQRNVAKYTRLYTDLGIDVMLASISPYDLLRPVPRAQVAAVEVLEYLLSHPQYDKLLLHGMSVGAYGFMEVMVKMEANESRYLCIRPRFKGQLWDSPCDLPGLKEGVARSLSKDRKNQETIMRGLDWFLEVRYEAATRHYVKTQEMYYKNYCRTPSLFLYSRADPVSVPSINTKLVNNWYCQGYEVYSKIFNQSLHVGHYAKYKSEYHTHVMAFLERIGILKAAGIELED